MTQVWHQFPCLYKSSPDLRTVSCHSHNQRRPLQTKLQTLNKLLIASQARVVALEDQQDLGLHQDRLTAPQPQGPMAQDQLTTTGTQDTRCRLDTFSNPDDENARRAVLLQFLCEQCHTGVSAWTKKTLATAGILAADMPTRIHCKRGPYPLGLYLKQELEEDGLPFFS